MAGQTLTTARPGGGAAALLRPVAEQLLGGELPVRLRAWDGSEAGPEGGPALVLRSREALRRLLWHPGELGLAQAYVTGELDVDGDLTEGLRRLWRAIRERGRVRGQAGPGGLGGGRPRVGSAADPRSAAAGSAVAGADQGPPAQPQPGPGRHLPPLRRARRVLPAHPGPAMAYSCALWLRDDPAYTLADAQRDKLDGICRKLGLGPGSRLLDVGCGWGSLSVHAARSLQRRRYRRHARAEQARFVQRPGSRRTGVSGWSPCGTRTTGISARVSTTRSPRSRWASTSATGSTRRSARSCATGCGRAGGC